MTPAANLGRQGGFRWGMAGQVGQGGVWGAGRVVPAEEAGRRGRQVGWYELVAANVYTAQEGVCNSRVKNTLQSG